MYDVMALTGVLSQRNKPGHIIILYDDNERMAPKAATVFVQRGVDNVFLLSGGLLYNRTSDNGHTNKGHDRNNLSV